MSTSASRNEPPVETAAFDPDALRQKYRDERDKRLRADGNEQYIEVSGGFGGLLAGARLRELGIEDIRMIDPAGDFGGTWYWNRYPGIACDIESYSYLPLLEEMGYFPTMKFASGFEILEYCQMMAERSG